MKNSFLIVSLVLLSACATPKRSTTCESLNPEVCALHEQVEAIKREQERQQAFRSDG